MRNLVAVIGLGLLLTACVREHPQTAEAFREAAKGAKSIVIERYQVDQPFHKIARTLKRNTQRCLSGNVRTVAHGAMSFQVMHTTYHPTLRLTKKKAEIHLQQRHRGGVINVTKAPADGHYLLVADVTSLRNGKSSVVLYRPRRGYQNITGSVKGWIDGTSSSCPDLTNTK